MTRQRSNSQQSRCNGRELHCYPVASPIYPINQWKKSNNHIISQKKKKTIITYMRCCKCLRELRSCASTRVLNSSETCCEASLIGSSIVSPESEFWYSKSPSYQKRSENFLSNRLKRWYLKSKHWIAIEYKIKRNRIRNRLTLIYPVIEASARFVVQLLFSARDLIWFDLIRFLSKRFRTRFHPVRFRLFKFPVRNLTYY